MSMDYSNLNHLVVSPDEQRRRHREFIKKSYVSRPQFVGLVVKGGVSDISNLEYSRILVEKKRTKRLQESLRRLFVEYNYLCKEAMIVTSREVLLRRAGSIAFGLTEAQLIASTRAMKFLVPRQVIMAFAAIVCKLRLADIARAFNRDHSTVHDAVDKFRGDVEKFMTQAGIVVE